MRKCGESHIWSHISQDGNKGDSDPCWNMSILHPNTLIWSMYIGTSEKAMYQEPHLNTWKVIPNGHLTIYNLAALTLCHIEYY